MNITMYNDFGHSKNSRKSKSDAYPMLWVLFSLCCVIFLGAIQTSFVWFAVGVLLVALVTPVIFLNINDRTIVWVVLFSVVFNAFYHPVFGVFASTVGYANVGAIKLALGVRSGVVAVWLAIIAVYLMPKLRSERLFLAAVVLFLIMLMLRFTWSNGGLSSRVTYLLNSLLPLISFLVIVGYMLMGQRVSLSLSDTLLGVLILIIYVGAVYFISLDFTYEFFRPDLASAIHQRPGWIIRHGEYGMQWYTEWGNDFYRRFVGSFSDPIPYGYFLATVVLALVQRKRFLLALPVLLVLFLSMSKGAWLFMFQAIALAAVSINRPKRTLSLAVLFLSVQLGVAGILDASNKMHLLGLIGGLKSVLGGGVVSILLGFGIGSGGNLAREDLVGGALSEGWLGSGSESGIGVVAYQLGLPVILLFLAFQFFFLRMARKYSLRRDFYEANNFIFAICLALFVNTFLQENCINSSILTIVLMGVLIINGNKSAQAG